MSQTFGAKPTEGEKKSRKKADKTAKVNIPVGHASTQISRRPQQEAQKRFIVDLDQEQSVSAIYSTIVFRPKQVLLEKKDRALITLARDNGIPLIEK